MHDMSDDQLTRLLGTLDRGEAPNPVFADQLFQQLTAQAPTARRSRLPWLLLAAALMVAAIAGGAVVGSGLVKLPGLSRNPLPAPSSSATSSPASASPSSAATPTASPEASPTDGATPTEVTAVAISVDGVVTATADRLTVRKQPGTSQEAIGALAKGAMSYVVDGPRQADGYDWYLLSGMGLPPESGCVTAQDPTGLYVCPMWYGWAAEGDGADRWLVPVEPECSIPSPSSPQAVDQLTPLACFGSRSITIRGYWPPAPAGEGGVCPISEDLRWIACPESADRLLDHATQDVFGGLTVVTLAVPPGIAMPERGQWVEVSGHYDDPAARHCTYGEIPEQSVLSCRGQFVVDEARIVSGPE
jgi:hypothetical protein